jgi:hypothetical protein
MQYQQTLYELGVNALALIAAAIGVDRRDLIQLVGAENGGIHLQSCPICNRLI